MSTKPRRKVKRIYVHLGIKHWKVVASRIEAIDNELRIIRRAFSRLDLQIEPGHPGYRSRKSHTP